MIEDKLFTEVETVQCLCGADCTEFHIGHRDGITFFTSADVAHAIEHDKAKRRALGVQIARARALLTRMGR